MPIRRQTIGTTGCDFTTPQLWYNSNKGDLVGSGLICIGEISGLLNLSSTTPSFLVMNQGETIVDENHYYHLKHMDGFRYQGQMSYDAEIVPPPYLVAGMYTVTGGVTHGINCTVPHSKFQGFVMLLSECVSSRDLVGMSVVSGYVDSVGVYGLKMNAGFYNGTYTFNIIGFSGYQSQFSNSVAMRLGYYALDDSLMNHTVNIHGFLLGNDCKFWNNFAGDFYGYRDGYTP